MEKRIRNRFLSSVSLLVVFAVWTCAVRFVDVRAIGPQGSSVGFATFNGFVHSLTGVNFLLYSITDWLGLVPIFVAAGFALFGFVQLIKRRSLCRVDADILILGIFFVAVISVYLLFENVVINYRPVLINGILEASYPSSTTLLVMCVMSAALMQFKSLIKNSIFRRFISALIIVFIVFMLVLRLLSGVHWITDIIGGVLLSAGLVSLYHTATLYFR